jgi:putative transposase
MDISHVYCGSDGWAHVVAVIDCHDREVIGWEFALRGRAPQAERALEMVCLARVGTVRPTGESPMLRSDNGLVFLSRRFREACSSYRLKQEYITLDTLEQNGLIERFFRSFKEECAWQQTFTSFAEARRVVQAWLEWYNRERPHQALGYLSPRVSGKGATTGVSSAKGELVRGVAWDRSGRAMRAPRLSAVEIRRLSGLTFGEHYTSGFVPIA